MMAVMASIERTETQLSGLLVSFGLEIDKIYSYTSSVYESKTTVVGK